MADITQALTPSISMSLKLGVSVGRNQVQRNEGNYSAIYLADHMIVSDAVMEIPPGNAKLSNISEQYKTMVISTNVPLKLEAIKVDGSTFSFTINRLLAFDDEVVSWALINLSQTEIARVAINMISYIPPVIVP